MTQKTTQSEITFVHHTSHLVEVPGEQVASRFAMERRKVQMIFEFTVKKGVPFTIEKYSNVYTTRDADTSHLNPEELKKHALAMLEIQQKAGYESLLKNSMKGLADYWSRMDILIDSENPFDQLSIRFAQYHLLVMTPKHDNRYGCWNTGLTH
jgi:hypothetical glycosyl hydrolase